MASVRHPAVAGLFYPEAMNELHGQVTDFLRNVKHKNIIPKALIAPHAGYLYSGGVAANAYGLLSHQSTPIEKVVILGPAHRVSLTGIAYSKADFFETPLGQIPVSKAIMEQAEALPFVHQAEEPFEGEHCLEVQLPFLQLSLPPFAIAPFLVGDISINEMTLIIDQLWGDEKTLIVVSTDLSHYQDYESACNSDIATSTAIENLDSDSISPQQACGWMLIKGLLRNARSHGLRSTKLVVKNSGDTAGASKDRVVGYGAYAFS